MIIATPNSNNSNTAPLPPTITTKNNDDNNNTTTRITTTTTARPKTAVTARSAARHLFQIISPRMARARGGPDEVNPEQEQGLLRMNNVGVPP